jgi:hypothetical protein
MNDISIRNKHEQKFQDRLIADIKALRGSAIHLEPIGHSGFPDLLVTFGDRYRLVELKSVENAHKQKFHTLFEEGQLSWHQKWYDDGNEPVITMIEVRSTGETIWFVAAGKACLIYFDWTLAMVRECSDGCTSPRLLCHKLKGEIIDHS